MRAVPTATVIRPPPIAAISIATPSGRLQCQPKKANDEPSMFWVMKTSSRIRIRKPATNDVHRAPARVNLAAGSLVGGPAVGMGTVGFFALGLSGEPG